MHVPHKPVTPAWCRILADTLAAVFALLVFVPAARAQAVEVWLTTSDLRSRLARQADASFAGQGRGGARVLVDEAMPHQEMDGFGVSLTDSSAWLMSQKLGDEQRVEAMEALFGAQGIRLSLLRQVIGTSDFTTEMYSYCDNGPDPEMNGFSIARDERYILPLVRAVLEINPEVRVMASPWSPPGWMKTSGSMIGGRMRPEYLGVYARYFVRFIRSYAAAGVPIWAVTPQNEPGYSPPHYPGMLMTVEEQTIFIRDHLGPAFRKEGLETLVLCFDHNYEDVATPLAILADPAASTHLAGSAFHHYGGDPSAMSQLHEQFPDKGIWFTEGGVGDWNDTFDNLAHEMIAIPRNWAKSIILWNAALDERDGPAIIGPDNTNQGMMTIGAKADGGFVLNPQYYYIGHLSKFVRPGAVRIASTHWEGRLETVAFRNPDGSIALVALNREASVQSIGVTWRGREFSEELPAHSLTTFFWNEAAPE